MENISHGRNYYSDTVNNCQNLLDKYAHKYLKKENIIPKIKSIPESFLKKEAKEVAQKKKKTDKDYKSRDGGVKRGDFIIYPPRKNTKRVTPELMELRSIAIWLVRSNFCTFKEAGAAIGQSSQTLNSFAARNKGNIQKWVQDNGFSMISMEKIERTNAPKEIPTTRQYIKLNKIKNPEFQDLIFEIRNERKRRQIFGK